MKRIYLGLIVFAIAIVGLIRSLPSTAQAAESNDPIFIYRQAGINSDQEDKIRKLAQTFEGQQRVRSKKIMDLVVQMRGLQLQPDPNADEVLGVQNEINKLGGEMALDRIKLLLDIRKVLTPDQKQKLVAILSQPGPGGTPGGTDASAGQ